MKQEVLIPAYYNEFKCIGSACEDTCCAGWKVSVDKESFNKYRKITSGPLAKELQQNISRERKMPSDLTYGKIKMDAKGACTFLKEDGLCKIHSELGEEYLCHTCTVYPRLIHTVDTRIEKSLGVSCPEAARLILLNPNGIEFNIDEEEVKKTLHNPTPDYFWDIRMFTIEILQTRQATIEERLITLGLFLEKVDLLEKKQWATELPALMNRYRQMILDPKQLLLLADLPTNLSFQMDLVHKLVSYRAKRPFGNQRYVDCLNDLVNGLQMVNGVTIQESIGLYKTTYEEIYSPFIIEHHYLLENYLVNSIFKSLFPKTGKPLFKQYASLVIHFLLIRTHLIGMSKTHNELTIELVLKCIQSFSKTFEHNTQFFVEVLKELEDKNNLSMAHMIVLIKN